MRKTLMLAGILLTMAFGGVAQADVLQTWTVSSPGDMDKAIKALGAAGVIAERHGAEAELWANEVSNETVLVQAFRFPDLVAWGRFQDAMSKDAAHRKWLKKFRGFRGHGELLINVEQPDGPTSAADGVRIANVTTWQAPVDRLRQLDKILSGAATLMRKHRLDVHLYRHGIGTRYLVIGARNYAQFTRRLQRRDADPAWQRFVGEAMKSGIFSAAQLAGQGYMRRLTPAKKRVVVAPAAPKPKAAVPTTQPKVVVLNPPAPKQPRPAAKRGKVWISGHYAWNPATKAYDWIPGRFKKIRSGKTWVPGRYTVEIRGKYKVKIWTPGYWR